MWIYYVLAAIAIGALILIVSIKVSQSRKSVNGESITKDFATAWQTLNADKSANGESITKDFATAWQTLNADLITKHLSPDFKYDSQWVYDTLDYRGYIEYIRGKFVTIRKSKSEIEARIVRASETEGVIAIRQDKGKPTFYVIQIKNGKVIKGDLCMFIL